MKPPLSVTPCALKSRQQEQQQCQEGGKTLNLQRRERNKELKRQTRRKAKDDSDLLTKSDSNGLNFPKKAENGLNFPKRLRMG